MAILQVLAIIGLSDFSSALLRMIGLGDKLLPTDKTVDKLVHEAARRCLEGFGTLNSPNT